MTAQFGYQFVSKDTLPFSADGIKLRILVRTLCPLVFLMRIIGGSFHNHDFLIGKIYSERIERSTKNSHRFVPHRIITKSDNIIIELSQMVIIRFRLVPFARLLCMNNNLCPWTYFTAGLGTTLQ